MEEKQDLKIYAFENALNIMLNNVEVFNNERVDKLFELSDRIYKYLISNSNA